MKTISLLSLLFTSIYVHADMVVTESVDMGERNMTMTLKIKGDKIRMDVTPQMSTIIDTNTGDTLMIMHEQKIYMTVSGEQAKATKQQIKKLGGQPTAAGTPAEKPKLVDTGKSEKVGAFNTEIYTMNTSTAKITLWVTKEIPNYAALKEQFRKMSNLSSQGAGAVPTPDTGDLQGFPVKTEMLRNGNTITTTVISAEVKPIDDAEMSPPAGYTKMAMPNFGGAGAVPHQ